MSFECEVIVKLNTALSHMNLKQFDFLLLNFACVYKSFTTLNNCYGRQCYDLVLKF